ncbi:MAG: peptidoglycan binding domain-containing protein, partial [Chloroflexi bacterium]|nr:peptidoglycan binding domain-containing protein [Chloroflexota bacterium]
MAVSEQSIDQVRVRRLWRPGRRAVLFVLMTFIGIGLVGGGLVVLHERQVGRILPGISAASVDLSGLTPDEARGLLASRLADLSTGGVIVRTGIGSTTVAFTDVGRTPDIDAMVADAVARGRGGSWLDEVIAAFRVQQQPESVVLRLGYDHDKAAATIAAWADRMTLNAVDAAVVGAPRFSIVPSVDGRRIDAAVAISALDQAMRDPATRAGAVVDAPTARVSAKLTTEMAGLVKADADRIAAEIRVRVGDRTWP